jgi:hypothetical protein
LKTQEAIDFFGSVKELAQFLNVYPQVIYKWGDYPPDGRQYELEVKTNGLLRAETNEN